MTVKRWYCNNGYKVVRSLARVEKSGAKGVKRGDRVGFIRASKRSYLIYTARKHEFDCVLSRHLALRRFSRELLWFTGLLSGDVWISHAVNLVIT